MPNIFWVGGTGANVALAFARMQELGLIGNHAVNHFFIDAPENFRKKDDGTFENIGVSAIADLMVSSSRSDMILKIARHEYETFGDFLKKHETMGLLFRGSETVSGCEHMFNNKVREGNYYMPAVAASMAGGEFLLPRAHALTTDNRSLICGSCYGGTGAGVTPLLVRLLVDANQTVEVVYLNRWLIDRTDRGANESVIRGNEHANLSYLSDLQSTLTEKKLRFFSFRVKEGWEATIPPGKLSNTLVEIENPYPYFVANALDLLLQPAGGARASQQSELYQVEIDRGRMYRNPAFCYFYAYAMLTRVAGRGGLTLAPEAILRLMSSRKPSWGMRRMEWKGKALDNLKTLVFGREGTRGQARDVIRKHAAELAEQASPRSANSVFEWPGFIVTRDRTPSPDVPVDLVSWPTIFASYYHFKAGVVAGSPEYRTALVSLIAMLLTKRVYVDNDQRLDDYGCRREIRAAPLRISDGMNDWGFAGEQGVYAWPTLDNIEKLCQELAGDPILQEALLKVYAQHSQAALWVPTSPFDQAIAWWVGAEGPRDAMRAGMRVWTNVEYVRGLETRSGRSAPQIGRVVSLDMSLPNRLSVTYTNGEILDVDCERHNLFVLPKLKKILQYTNTIIGDLERRSDKRVERSNGSRHLLVLNYATVLDLSQTKYEVDIVHPAYLLWDGTFEFSKQLAGRGAISAVPWPIRKNYMVCLKPKQGWNQPPSIYDGCVDMRPHEVLNWGTVEAVDLRQNADRPFLVKTVLTMRQTNPLTQLEPSDAEYQGYVWPWDPNSGKFNKEWRYYSVLVTARPKRRTLAAAVKASEKEGRKAESYTECWYSCAGREWQLLDAVEGDLYIGAWKGDPPTGLAVEILGNDETDKYGALFVLPEAVDMAKHVDGVARLGIDFGTSNTCCSVLQPNGLSGRQRTETVAMNPAELLYTVFSNSAYRDSIIDFAWVPYFDPTVVNSCAVFPTGVFYSPIPRIRDSKKSNHDDEQQGKAEEVSGGDAGIPRFVNQTLEFDWRFEHRPLQHFSIPGDKLDDAVRNEPHCYYEIKWETNPSRRLLLWKDFLTAYVLLLAAHFYVDGRFSNCKSIDLSATVPLRFAYANEQLRAGSTLEDSYAAALQAAARDVTSLTGKEITFSPTNLSYEAIASLPDDLTDGRISIVIDVGGGTTDVAILDGTRVHATSSFLFAGRNPFGRAFKAHYLLKQLEIRREGVKPFEGNRTIVDIFLSTLGVYTSLLTAAVLRQMKLTRSEQRDAVENLVIYPLGQGWHLARFHEAIIGAQNPNALYVDRIIKHKILTAFNELVRSQVFDNDFPKLTTSNIKIIGDPLECKLACSKGAVRPLQVLSQGGLDSPSFLGLSHKSRGGREVEWWEATMQEPVMRPEDLHVDASSPSLIINKSRLGPELVQQYKDLSGGDPINNGFIRRNVLEFLLEMFVGVGGLSEGYSSAKRSRRKTIPTLNTDWLENRTIDALRVSGTFVGGDGDAGEKRNDR